MLQLYADHCNPELPEIQREELLDCVREQVPVDERRGTWFLVLHVEPFLDTLLVSFPGKEGGEEPDFGKTEEGLEVKRRFSFREGWAWDAELENAFSELCVKNGNCRYDHGQMDRIYAYYKKNFPAYHLKRYYTQDFRLLEHIYHCCRRNTAKEILYKAGLDELAAGADELDELDLLSTSPSAIYGGLPMRVLRALNCREGSAILLTKSGREFIKKLNQYFPALFQYMWNDAQCAYLEMLMEEKLTVGEAGRLITASRPMLCQIWNRQQFRMIQAEQKVYEEKKKIAMIDPLYEEYLKENRQWTHLKNYLLLAREEYDREIRRSNRRRPQDWQERGKDYIIRFPQTINDFCREAIYMRSCLLGYVPSVLYNTTTILFMRRAQDVNTPFITIEVFQGELMQAYHRFNMDCNEEERRWILEYCKRHDIRTGKFSFGAQEDMLF